jgi:hypothetical protein
MLRVVPSSIAPSTPRGVAATPQAIRKFRRDDAIETAAQLAASARELAELRDSLACACARVAAAEQELSALRVAAARESLEADATFSRLARLIAIKEADNAALSAEIETARLRDIEHAAAADELSSARCRIEELEAAVVRMASAHALELCEREAAERCKLENLHALVTSAFATLAVPQPRAAAAAAPSPARIEESLPRAGSGAPAPTPSRAGLASSPRALALRRALELPTRAEEVASARAADSEYRTQPADFLQEGLRNAVWQLFFVDGGCNTISLWTAYVFPYVAHADSIFTARV